MREENRQLTVESNNLVMLWICTSQRTFRSRTTKFPMAPKRNQPASVAEPPQSPKKRASLGLIGTRDVAKKGKRKIEALEIEVQEKAPKRTAAKATTRRASKVAEVDDVGHQPEVKETAVIKRVKATMGIMTNGKG